MDKYKGPFIAAVFFLFILLFFEGLGYLLTRHKTPMEHILAVLEQDFDLFWKQRVHLSTSFSGKLIKTNQFGFRSGPVTGKGQDVFRIVCLGASPTFGWGVGQEQTYAHRLQDLLQSGQTKAQRVEVMNAGSIGYSSFQGLKLLKKSILSLKPDLITVSYVINDVDKHRFFRSNGKSDMELEPISPLLIAVDNIMSRSHFVALLKRLMVQSSSTAMQYFGKTGQRYYMTNRRVSDQSYAKNLLDFVRIAHQEGIQIVFIKMPVNLPSVDPVSEKNRSQSDQFIQHALKAAGKEDYQKAIQMLNQALAYHPHSSETYYYLGQYHEVLRQSDRSHAFYKKSVEMELHECASLSRVYNDIMQKVADDRKIVVVDIVEEFKKFNQMNNAQYLFLDPDGDTIHPNAVGHNLIAQKIYERVVRNDMIRVQN